MQIQIQVAEGQASDALLANVEGQIEESLAVYRDQITRVEVHLHDENGPKSGLQDKRCVIEVRLAGHQPLAVEDRADDMYDAVRAAAGKAERAVRRKVEKQRERTG